MFVRSMYQFGLFVNIYAKSAKKKLQDSKANFKKCRLQLMLRLEERFFGTKLKTSHTNSTYSNNILANKILTHDLKKVAHKTFDMEIKF